MAVSNNAELMSYFREPWQTTVIVLPSLTISSISGQSILELDNFKPEHRETSRASFATITFDLADEARSTHINPKKASAGTNSNQPQDNPEHNPQTSTPIKPTVSKRRITQDPAVTSRAIEALLIGIHFQLIGVVRAGQMDNL